jgi:hypothetical protein
MTKEEIERNLIFLFMRGSQAYGTNNAESDEDFGGVCLPTPRVIMGIEEFEQDEQWVDANGEKIDKTVYNVVKVLDLLSKTNPNIIDFVFAPEHCIVHTTPEWQKIVDIRDTFITKKAKWAYQGYAESQLNRIEMHRGYLLNPPKSKPTRADFDLPEESIFPSTQIDVIARISTDYVAPEDMDSFFNEFKFLFDHEGAIIFKKYVDAEHLPFAIKDYKKGQKEFLRMISSISGRFLKDEFVGAARNELRYLAALEQWTAYKRWSKNRNEKRKILEQKSGYDCYSDDTEFLTNDGWKKFDDIDDSNTLATVFWDCPDGGYSHRPQFKLEYQTFYDKFDGIYNGNMYHFSGTHLDTLVTANHNMLIQEFSRNLNTSGKWKLNMASHVPDAFNIVQTCTPVKKTSELPVELIELSDIAFPITAYLSLMGWYLSDGTLEFRDGKVKSIKISQKKDNRLYPYFIRFCNKYGKLLGAKVYEYTNGNIVEASLVITHKSIRNKLYYECGHYSTSKRIPRYVMGLSKRLKEVLFDAMVNGDGTIRKHKTIDSNIIYYTTNKYLADDVNELCFLSGWLSNVYGPYEQVSSFTNKPSVMYQVFCDKNASQTKRLIKSTNVTHKSVTDQRIVCFSVSNSTLVTRRNGNISIQGNCKHAMHLIRLLRMSVEIMEGKGVMVDRRNIDRESLMEIRMGNVRFDDVLQECKTLKERGDKAYAENMDLPVSVDDEKIEKVKTELLREAFNR